MDQHPDHPRRPDHSDLSVEITSWGPDQATINAMLPGLLENPTVQEHLGDTRYRLLAFDLVNAEGKTNDPRPPNRYRATVYDYTHNRTVLIEGCLDEPALALVSESGLQPLPSHEEFDAAVAILMNDSDLGPSLREGRLHAYQPMPPLITSEAELPDGRVERTLAVGLLSSGDELQHEIVGVNMINPRVIHYEGGAPQGSAAGYTTCGRPNAGQSTVSSAAGQVWITVTQGGQVIWRFLVIRPAASSGTNGSGIELRFVDYRGKRVLYRAHVPILNVKYDSNGCGPYRDWQNQEGMLQANGINVAPGFLLCSGPAQTILDTGSDVGNFLGVAIYVQGQEVVLVSEMQAGWYRYVSEWRFHTDGTIRPRFGFSAVDSSCVCIRHHHHVYWRLDFDIQTPGNNIVREFNDPPLFGTSNWHTKHYEIKRFRDVSRKRKWRVLNATNCEGYDIIPGADDGAAINSPDWPFPVGDVWILRYHASEIDDGSVAVGPPYEAGLDSWVNGESVINKDVVIWYGAHFTHDIGAEPPGHFGHIVGPELKPFNW